MSRVSLCQCKKLLPSSVFALCTTSVLLCIHLNGSPIIVSDQTTTDQTTTDQTTTDQTTTDQTTTGEKYIKFHVFLIPLNHPHTTIILWTPSLILTSKTEVARKSVCIGGMSPDSLTTLVSDVWWDTLLSKGDKMYLIKLNASTHTS